ncbi:MAG: hypothetical protein H7X77_01640, partial [Anaerolineae bacterium]|nr:hypothetical protein [Anaerolineae bacterium]
MLKSLRYLCIIALMFIVSLMASGQGAPEQIQDALALFNQDTGQNLVLTDLYWTWEQLTATDSSLGCPKDGEFYTQGQVVTYRFLFTYDGNIYDYRVSADRSNVRACGVTSTDAPTSTPSADSTPDPRSNRLCPTPAVGISYIRTRFAPGLQGFIPEGNASRVRVDPATTAAQVGELGAGTVFDIIAGPTCDAEGYVWWQILAGSLSGWIAEGQGSEYFVEPLPPAAPLTGYPALSLDNLPLVAELDKLQGNFSRKVAFSLDSKLVALGDTGSEGAWIYDNLSEAPRLLPSTLPLTTMAFGSPGSDKFLALFGGEDGGIRLWDLTLDEPVVERVYLLGHDDPVSAVAYKGDGSLIASSGGLAYTTQNDLAADTNAILLWDVNTVALKLALRGHLADVTGLAFLSDGSLVSSSLDGSVRWWDTTTGVERT